MRDRLTAAVAMVAVVTLMTTGCAANASGSAPSQSGPMSPQTDASATPPATQTAAASPPSTPSTPQTLTANSSVPYTSGEAGFIDGAVWIPQLQTLAQIDPATGHVKATVPLDDQGRLTFMQGAAMCVSTKNAGTECVDTHTHKVSHRYAEGLAASGFGSLWGFSTDGTTLLRVSPSTGKVTGQVRIEASTDWAPLVATGGGSVWVAAGTVKALLRVNPATMKITTRISGFDAVDSLLVPGYAYGAAWVQQNANGAGVLYRIDPRTNRIAGRVPLGIAQESGGYGGSDLAFEGGSVWTADSSPTVTRVDPKTMTAAKVYRINISAPEFISVGQGSIWVSNEDDGGRGSTERLSP